MVGSMRAMPLIRPIFCMYDINLLVNPVYLKVLKEGESKHSVVALLCS